jgi:pimeloyl-ACP methyl ester carboxylesterase
MRSPRILVAALTAAVLAGAGGSALASTATAPRGAAPETSRPKLKDPHPCLDLSGAVEQGFTCYTLTVPLDHAGRTPGTLDLQVGASDNVDAPKGTLLVLSGGPGQGGVYLLDRLAHQRLPELSKEYRFVMIDQRGTGPLGAINCPKLQAQVGSSDIAVPTRDAISECSVILGRNARFYSTDQSVGDYDSFRRALGVRTMAVDGVSYGAFTAARYAIAHPHNVSKLVLDSVLPSYATAADSLYLTGLTAEARVLRGACATAPACGFDPAKDLAYVVRHRSATAGVRLFDAIVSYEFVDPTYRDPAQHGGLIDALHSARGGDQTNLDAIIADMNPADGTPPAAFSSGLHAATLCADMVFPWGNAAAPVAGREAKLERVVKRLRQSQVWPYTRAVAAGQGFIQTCLPWPAEPANSNPDVDLPRVPTLLVNGTNDLSTPLEWARQELARAPEGRLVEVPGASHSIQNRERGHVGRDAVIAFLNG